MAHEEGEGGEVEASSPLEITVFTEFTCPYSYTTEAVLWRMPPLDVRLTFRAFELYPAPADPVQDRFDGEEWVRIEGLASESGLEVRRPEGERPRTGKAHEAARFAAEHGTEVELRRRIYEAYWQENLDIGRIDVLASLAEGVGLGGEDLKIALDIDTYRDAVEADTRLAARLRIPGTPAIFLGTGPSARIVVGAHSAGDLRAFVNDAIRYSRRNE